MIQFELMKVIGNVRLEGFRGVCGKVCFHLKSMKTSDLQQRYFMDLYFQLLLIKGLDWINSLENYFKNQHLKVLNKNPMQK